MVQKDQDGKDIFLKTEGKIDSGGSVTLSHETFLRDIKHVHEYGIHQVKLLGIGGETAPLTRAGLLHVKKQDGTTKRILSYVFNKKVGLTDKLLLLSCRTQRDAGVNILYQIDESLLGKTSPLLFWDEKVPTGRADWRLTTHRLALMQQSLLEKARTPRRVVMLSGAYRTHAKEELAQETQLPEEDSLHDVGQISLNQIERVRLAFSGDMRRTKEGAATLEKSPASQALLAEHVGDKQEISNSLEEHEQIMQERGKVEEVCCGTLANRPHVRDSTEKNRGQAPRRTASAEN